MNNSVTLGTIFDEAAALLALHWPMLLGVLVGSAGFYSFADLQADVNLGNSMYMAGGFVILYLQLFAIVRMARAHGLLAARSHENGSPTLGLYFRAFGQSIVYSVAIFIGALLLILPGIWLVTVWFVALPVMLIENESILDSLGRSKQLVTPYFWPVLAVALIVAAAIIGTFGLVIYLFRFPLFDGPLLVIGMNLFCQAAIVAGWVLSLATYIRLASAESGGPIEEVFA